MLRFSSIAVALVALSACSSPDLSGTNFPCNTDADCSGGRVCGSLNGVSACIVPLTNAIRIGMSAPLTGPNANLGLELQRGVNALFKRLNEDDGGVFGRPLVLDCRDDNDDPVLALANTKKLLDITQEVADPEQPDVRGQNSVLALLGSVGTPPMLATAPLATKNRTIFFAPFTGAQKYLRDGTNSPYIYNFRAGFYQEMDAIVDYLSTSRTPRVITGADSYSHIIAFTQADAYGDAGYAGLVNAFNTRIAQVPQPDPTAANPSIVRLSYDPKVPATVDQTIADAQAAVRAVLNRSSDVASIAFVMVDTHVPGAKFTRQMRDWANGDSTRAGLLDLLFVHVSLVGSEALADALRQSPDTYVDAVSGTRKSYAQGVMITQVVPYYESTTVGMADYRRDIDEQVGGEYSFTSVEGYFSAALFIEALRQNGPSIDTDSLINTLDSRFDNYDLGIGAPVSFSPTNHQASSTVWGSEIKPDGTFSMPFVWNPRNKIVAGSN